MDDGAIFEPLHLFQPFERLVVDVFVLDVLDQVVERDAEGICYFYGYVIGQEDRVSSMLPSIPERLMAGARGGQLRPQREHLYAHAYGDKQYSTHKLAALTCRLGFYRLHRIYQRYDGVDCRV